jgi:hypothetical protein
LPVNLMDGEGVGYVSLTTDAAGACDGAEIVNEAAITFDVNRTERTNQVTNLINNNQLPDPFNNLSPPNRRQPPVPTETALYWEDAAHADRYEVFLWMDGQPNPTPVVIQDPLRSVYRAEKPLRPGTIYRWRVEAVNSLNGSRTVGAEWSFRTQTPFVRGDGNADGTIDLSDAVFVLGYLFQGRQEPLCLDAADANDDGDLDLSDERRQIRSHTRLMARQVSHSRW